MAVFQLSEMFISIFNRHCVFVCFFTMIILILIDQMINPSTRITHQHCDAMRIQEHYMNNLSAFRLLQTRPVYSNLFQYKVINIEICGKGDTPIDLLIFITSKSGSYERRNAIRRTYGNLNNIFKYTHDTSSRLEVRILFMINFDESPMKSVLFEQQAFNDIVQVNIPEEYLLNTYRDLAILDWSSIYCSQARFIFKMSDSVFLNPFLLLKFINENENDRINFELPRLFNMANSCLTIDARLPLLHGFIHSNEHVLRQKITNNEELEKFIISKDEYPCDIYPNYFDDNAYLLSYDARDLILCTFYRQSNMLLPLSSIYITGILAEYLHIERQPLLNYKINFDSKLSCDTFFSETDPLQAFACITNIEFSKDILERYHTYWQMIINSQMENNEK